MRRLLVLVSFTIVVAASGIIPAEAHACATPVEIPVGEVTTIVVGVPAEIQPVVEVDVGIPDGFLLDEANDVGPWKVEHSGSTLRYRGGELAPYACASFQLQGTAERQAQLSFPVTTRAEDGSEVKFTAQEPDDPHAAQLVYAGFSPPTSGDDGGSSWLSGSTIGVAVTVVVIAGAYFLSRRLQQEQPGRSTKPIRPARRRR
ncbi:MAG: hypothetical protein ACRDZ3_04315 [Acidimicrobiia bacterium]